MRSVPTNREEHTAGDHRTPSQTGASASGLPRAVRLPQADGKVSKAMPQHISPLLLIQNFQNEILLRHSSESTVVSRALSLVWLLSVKGGSARRVLQQRHHCQAAF